MEGGAAFTDGRISVGDRLVAVKNLPTGDFYLDNCTHEESVQVGPQYCACFNFSYGFFSCFFITSSVEVIGIGRFASDQATHPSSYSGTESKQGKSLPTHLQGMHHKQGSFVGGFCCYFIFCFPLLCPLMYNTSDIALVYLYRRIKAFFMEMSILTVRPHIFLQNQKNVCMVLW